MTAPYTQLLVHIDASDRSHDRLALARRLCARHGAALAALYAVTPAALALPAAPVITADVAGALRGVDDDKRQRAWEAISAAMARSPEDGPVASWTEVVDAPVVAAFARQALYADLLVLGQQDPAAAWSFDVPPDFVETVLSASGRPALVVPYTGHFDSVGDRIVIAWKPTPEAARAVAAAVPLLQRAARVHVVSWPGSQEDSEAASVRGPRLDLEGYLRRHGVQAQWHRNGDEPAQLGELLLSRVSELEADLLVMGCYGHSRAREWVLGGASRTVLRSMTLPVLMAH
jgi:nucleotide-binding universal stress UspA family protein